MKQERKTFPRRRKKNKIQKGITSIRRVTLSGEVMSEQKKARQGHASQRAENLDAYATGMENNP